MNIHIKQKTELKNGIIYVHKLHNAHLIRFQDCAPLGLGGSQGAVVFTFAHLMSLGHKNYLVKGIAVPPKLHFKQIYPIQCMSKFTLEKNIKCVHSLQFPSYVEVRK